MATNPTSPSALPELSGSGGLVNSNTTNDQQKANFSSLWGFLAYLFGLSGTRLAAFNTLATDGGTVGSNLAVTGGISTAGNASVAGNVSSQGNVSGINFSIPANQVGGYYMQERNNAASTWTMYATSGYWRLWCVNGDRMLVDGYGNVTFTGDVVAASDERLKKDIQPIDGALDKVLQSRGVYFRRKDCEHVSIGVLAQEVLPILPELVHESEKGMLSVNYQGFVGVLIESTKAQNRQIAELRKQVEELRQRIGE